MLASSCSDAILEAMISSWMGVELLLRRANNVAREITGAALETLTSGVGRTIVDKACSNRVAW